MKKEQQEQLRLLVVAYNQFVADFIQNNQMYVVAYNQFVADFIQNNQMYVDSDFTFDNFIKWLTHNYKNIK